MYLRSLIAERYRSLHSIHMELDRVNVFVGGNGVGKSNLYHAMRLLRAAASNRLAAEILSEGGMGSALWGGGWQKKDLRRIRLEAVLCDPETALDMTYRVEIGLPEPMAAAFMHEPQVKLEELSLRHGTRPIMLLLRDRNLVKVADGKGRLEVYEGEVLPSETALGILADEGRSPELALFRRALSGWRFYHGFRTDPGSPLRKPSLAAVAPLLDEDGGNLAAVFATLTHISSDRQNLDKAVAGALGGARLSVPEPVTEAQFELSLPDFDHRLFSPRELSDGQLRFLALCGALNAYRLPGLIALNEPETSLHPEMLPPLAEMIAEASRRTQVWVVTHSQTLASEIQARTGSRPCRVLKSEGRTQIEGRNIDGSRSFE